MDNGSGGRSDGREKGGALGAGGGFDGEGVWEGGAQVGGGWWCVWVRCSSRCERVERDAGEEQESRGLTVVGRRRSTTHRRAPLLGSPAGPISPEHNPAHASRRFAARAARRRAACWLRLRLLLLGLRC